MQIDLKTDLLKADGFTDAEIASIRQYLEAAPFLDNTATVVRLASGVRWVCQTVAVAIKAIRPEAYIGTAGEMGMPQEVIDNINEEMERRKK